MILRASGLGDLLTAVPALRAIARAFPLHERVLCAPVAYAPLVPLMRGAIDRVVDTRGLAVPLAIAPRPEVAINLHGRGPQSTELLAAVEPHRLVGFRPAAVAAGTAGTSGPVWRAGEHEIDRWCRLLTEAGIPADPAELELTVPAPPRPEWRGALVVHPGASAPSRRWPAARYTAVARAAATRGARVVVTGASEELPLARHIATGAGLRADAVLAGRLDVGALAAVVAHASAVVCGDTGIAHLATAFATPSVVLFGPTPPTEWGPRRPDRHRVLWAGARGEANAARTDPGLLRIGVDDVVAALESLASLGCRDDVLGRRSRDRAARG